MIEDRPCPLSSATKRAFTANVVSSATPCIDAAINVLTAD